MRIILILSILLMTLTSSSINDKDLYGTWIFDKLESEGLSDGPMQMMTGMFESITFIFNKDKTYSNDMLGHKEDGTFLMTENSLILTSDTGVAQNFTLVDLSSISLVISYKDLNIFLKKLDKKVAKVKSLTTSDSKSQLIGKWEYVSVENTTLDDSYPKNSDVKKWITLKKDGTYILKSSNNKEKGDWSIQGRNEFVILKSGETESRLKLDFIDLNNIILYSRLEGLEYKLSK